MSSDRWRTAALLVVSALVLGGVALRANAYAAPRSLWLDEAFLALNIVRRTPQELLLPLDYNQGAPIGFLLLQWLSVALFGATEAAFRLTPLIAGIVSVALFALLGWRMLGVAGVPAVALVALAPPLIAYSVEAKQYAVDVLATIVVLLAARAAIDGATARRLITLGGVGAVLVWWSHPVIFVLAAAGLAVGLKTLLARQWRAFGVAMAALVTAAASFGATYIVSLASLQGNPALRAFWRETFWPWPPETVADAIWPLESIVFGLARTLDTGWPIGAAVVLGIGLAALARRAWTDALLCGLPILTALAASAAQAYPFGGRLILFLAPVFALLIAAGVQWVWARRRIGKPAAVALAAVIIVWPTAQSLSTEPPVLRQEVRPLLQYVRATAESDDRLYVFRAALPAFQFYEQRFPIRLRTQIGASLVDPRDWQPYLDDVRSLHGRVWVLFSHTKYGEDQFYLAELDRLGQRLDALEQPGASLYLFRLPDAPPAADPTPDRSDTPDAPATPADTEHTADAPANGE